MKKKQKRPLQDSFTETMETALHGHADPYGAEHGPKAHKIRIDNNVSEAKIFTPFLHLFVDTGFAAAFRVFLSLFISVPFEHRMLFDYLLSVKI